MESDVPFKAYYRDEIRRFTLRTDESLNYAGLVQRLQGVFDISPTVQLKLRWLDSEGDYIAFNSSSELTDAVLQLTIRTDREPGAVVKVHVKEDAGQGFDQSAISHPGVFCDGCNTGIKGYRFKCQVCPDYDLCLTCLNRDMHSQHQMMLFRRPEDRHFGGGGGGWGGPRHPRCFRQFWGDGGNSGSEAGNEGGCRWRRFCRGGGGGGCHMRDTQSGTTGAHGKSTSTATATSAASTASVGTEYATATCDVGTEKLIEHVTSAINTFLEPLGIDASIQVMRQEADASVQAQPQQQQQSSEASIKASLITEAKKVQFAQSQASTGDTRQPVESSVAFKQSLETSGASFAPPPTSSYTDADSPPPGDFEFVGVPPPPKSNAAAPPPHTAAAAAAAAAEATTITDPKIARALEHMSAMGFNNEGGWLARLLVAKDGDICAVLDAIRPQVK